MPNTDYSVKSDIFQKLSSEAEGVFLRTRLMSYQHI